MLCLSLADVFDNKRSGLLDTVQGPLGIVRAVCPASGETMDVGISERSVKFRQGPPGGTSARGCRRSEH